MKIEILGTGCAKCRKLHENAKEAVEKAGVDADIIKVTDLNKISGYGIMVTPAVVVDGTVRSSGKVPSVEDILGWL